MTDGGNFIQQLPPSHHELVNPIGSCAKSTHSIAPVSAGGPNRFVPPGLDFTIWATYQPCITMWCKWKQSPFHAHRIWNKGKLFKYTSLQMSDMCLGFVYQTKIFASFSMIIMCHLHLWGSAMCTPCWLWDALVAHDSCTCSLSLCAHMIVICPWLTQLEPIIIIHSFLLAATSIGLATTKTSGCSF